MGAGPSGARLEGLVGIADGGRTGITAIVAGILFLVMVLLAPLVQLIAPVVVAPALLITGTVLLRQVRLLDWAIPDDALPAAITIALVGLTFDIGFGVGAGLVTFALLKLVRGKIREVHPLTWLVAALYVVFFLRVWTLGYL
jgi:AGZA family xanthine/uracil permease-like MFS transporter